MMESEDDEKRSGDLLQIPSKSWTQAYMYVFMKGIFIHALNFSINKRSEHILPHHG
jgi:hypothetical protein